MSSVTTTMCSEPPFLGSTFTVNVTPGRVRNARRSPSLGAKISGVGLVADVDCSTGISDTPRAPQNTIEENPIAKRTDRTKTPPDSPTNYQFSQIERRLLLLKLSHTDIRTNRHAACKSWYWN